jgi:hypothetical protein
MLTHDPTAPVVRINIDAAMMNEYLSDQIFLDDPFMLYCKTTSRVDCLDVARGVRNSGEGITQRMLRLYEACGIHNATIVPCQWGAFKGGVFLFAGQASMSVVSRRRKQHAAQYL